MRAMWRNEATAGARHAGDADDDSRPHGGLLRAIISGNYSNLHGFVEGGS